MRDLGNGSAFFYSPSSFKNMSDHCEDANPEVATQQGELSEYCHDHADYTKKQPRNAPLRHLGLLLRNKRKFFLYPRDP
jgi:hypothetical protein